MEVRVATWNLNRRGQATWDALVAIPADVVLVQEARPPTGWEAPDAVSSWPPINEPATWADLASRARPADIVLLNRHLSLRPRPAMSSPVETGRGTAPAGTLVVADVQADERYLLTVASVYAMFQPVEDTAQSDAYQTINSVIDDLAPLIESPDSRLLLGGDFNLWLHTVHPTPQRRAVFDRLAALGMVDCVQARDGCATEPMPGCVCGSGAGCDNVRTYRHRNQRDSLPWQNDYLYASADLAPLLATWRTLNTEWWWSHSDHCPVLATFRLND